MGATIQALLRWCLLTGVGLALPAGPVCAQTTRTYRTVEARLCAARVVVRGTITDLTRSVVVEPGGQDATGTSWPDGIVDYTVTVRGEQLKGARTGKLRLARRTSAFDRRLDQWREARTSFLWFVGRAGEAPAPAPESNWDAVRLGPPVAAEGGYTTDAPPVFSTDLRVLRDPATILARAQAFARRQRDCVIYRFTIPGPLAQLCAPGADANFVEVPVDAALRKTAQRLLSAPETFLPEDSPFRRTPAVLEALREEGRKALQHLRTLDRV